MKSSNEKKFENIARQYKTIRKKNPDQHIDYCIQQKTLIGVIEVAAKAIDGQNRIHSHQRRVGRVKLNLFAEQLKLTEPKISKVNNFDVLLSIVKSVKTERIAELAHYDTAVRIGAYLGLFPDKIFLHSGTRVGAKNLLGININKREYIQIDELPKEFLQHDLTALEFEDILCIFKDEFKKPFVTDRLKVGRPCGKKT